jgi:hypothetical protein
MISDGKIIAPGAEQLVKKRVEPFRTKVSVGKYTAGTGKIYRNSILAESVIVTLVGKAPPDCFLYRTDMTSSEMVMVKLSLSKNCTLFTTTSEFVDETLPLLDLLVLTTSSIGAQLMEVYVSTEDKTALRELIAKLKLDKAHIQAMFRKASDLYNRAAPGVIADVKAKRCTQIGGFPRKGELLTGMLNRNLIAQRIREQFIADHIQRIKY